MLDPSALDERAMQEAGYAGGDYLDSIKVYDLRLLKDEQWQTFLRAVCSTYARTLMPDWVDPNTLAQELAKAHGKTHVVQGGPGAQALADQFDDTPPF